MKIDFFETENGFDNRAISGGVYQVELMMEGKESICLYVGESVWIASRCGKHLYALFEDPSYFGLTEDDLKIENMILKFSVVDEIKGKKSELGVGSYKEQELEAIKTYEPVTQLSTSDSQIRNVDKKIEKVQEMLRANGFK